MIAKNDLYKIAHPILEKLSAAKNGTSYLAIEKDNMIVYLDNVEGEAPIRATCSAGDRKRFRHLQTAGVCGSKAVFLTAWFGVASFQCFDTGLFETAGTIQPSHEEAHIFCSRFRT